MNLTDSMLFLILAVEFTLESILFLATPFLVFINKDELSLREIFKKYENLAKALLILIGSMLFKIGFIILFNAFISLEAIKIFSLVLSLFFLSVSVTLIFKYFRK